MTLTMVIQAIPEGTHFFSQDNVHWMLCCFTKRRFIFPNLEKLRPLGQPDLSFMNCLHHSSFPQDWKVEKEKILKSQTLLDLDCYSRN